MKQGSKIAGGNPERGRVDNDYYATHPNSTKAFLEVCYYRIVFSIVFGCQKIKTYIAKTPIN